MGSGRVRGRFRGFSFLRIYKVAIPAWAALLIVFVGCSEPYDSALLKAAQLQREGKCEQAIKIYEKTMPRIPAENRQELAAAQVGYGDCLTNAGKLREAFLSYQNASQNDAQNVDAHLRLAQFLVGEKPDAG